MSSSFTTTITPTAFICPISQDIMTDPVILIETGATYERREILKWLSNHNTDPLTNEVLKNKTIIPNRALRTAIEESNVLLPTYCSEIITKVSPPTPPPSPPLNKTSRPQQHSYESNQAIARLPPSAPIEPSCSPRILSYRDLQQANNTEELCAVGCINCKEYKAIGENSGYYSCYCVRCHKTWKKEINHDGRQPQNTKERCGADCDVCAQYTNLSCYCYICHKKWRETKVPLPALKNRGESSSKVISSNVESSRESSNKKRCVIS